MTTQYNKTLKCNNKNIVSIYIFPLIVIKEGTVASSQIPNKWIKRLITAL